MERRYFLQAGLAGISANSLVISQPKQKSRAWFDLRFYYLRNDLDRSRLDAFFADAYLPALGRIEKRPAGFFTVSIGPLMPTLVSLTCFASLADMETTMEKLSSDDAWNKALDEFDRSKAMTYIRIESRLLRAFSSMPGLEVPLQSEGKPPRVFELRIYESRNMRSSETKIKMFDDGEIEIFRRCGMLPIFFGQTMVGSGLPSLTYMLGYDSMEMREEVWRRFASHPDWQALRSKPGLADSDIVSNISGCFLRPTAYSDIR